MSGGESSWKDELAETERALKVHTGYGEPREESEEKEIVGSCMVCKGDIIKDVATEFNPMSGPLIIGPGSRQQFSEVLRGYYCTGCGLKYQFPPQAITKESSF